ncbi:baseplate protein [Pseudomonas phage vB_PF_Y1-MI]|nr:baseplate protein [Pseudomonas phage vB_PF_Y1-MI]
MASDVLTYSPSDVKLIVCGHVLTGVVSVTLEWKGSKPFTVYRGIRGRHTRVFSPDLYATVTVELLQTSITNDVFTSILTQDRLLQSARIEFSVNDKSGTTAYQTSEAFLSAYPDIGLSEVLQSRKWEIQCLDFLSGGLGGNARQGFDILDPVSGAIDYISGKGSDLLDSAIDSLPVF